MSWLKRLFSNTKEEEIKVTNNYVYLDLGNSSIKAIYKNKRVCFKASIRKISDEEVIDQNNIINVNGEYFIIGEDHVPFNDVERKIDRRHIKELILYTLTTLGVEGAIGLKMLLPYTQLKNKNEWDKKLEGTNKVYLNDERIIKSIKINSLEVYPEGATAINNIVPTMLDKIIIDIGGGTTDIFSYNENNNLLSKRSFNLGTRDLIGKYAEVLNAKSESQIEKYFKRNHRFTKRELEGIAVEAELFLNELMSFAYKGVLSYCDPQSTELLFIGGGSLTLKENIKQWFKHKEFKCTFLEEQKSIFANLEGLIVFCSKNKKVQIPKVQIEESTKVQIKEIEEVQFEKNIIPKGIIEKNTKIKKVQNSENEKSTKGQLIDIKKVQKKNHIAEVQGTILEEVQRYKEQGYKQKEIAEKLDLSVSTIKNYYKQLRDIAEN